MKWKSKDSRYIKKFALKPITIADETRWLETVYIHTSTFFYKFITKEEYKAAQAGKGRPSLLSMILGMKWGCRKTDVEEGDECMDE